MNKQQIRRRVGEKSISISILAFLFPLFFPLSAICQLHEIENPLFRKLKILPTNKLSAGVESAVDMTSIFFFFLVWYSNTPLTNFKIKPSLAFTVSNQF